MQPLEPAGRPAGWNDDEAASPAQGAPGAGERPAPDEPAAPAGFTTLEAGPGSITGSAAAGGATGGGTGGGPAGFDVDPAPSAPALEPSPVEAGATPGNGAGPLGETGVPSPWAGIELPPTATSRRRRKRGHRGGVGRRGGRRIAQPNPEDDPLYPFKVQAAQELGLWPKVEAEGWGALTSLESGRIGGYMQRLLKEAVEEGRLTAEEAQRLLQQRRIRPASTET
ncbi:small, acid-soluble spore protein, alpha/beta type [Thermaerobacter litoralis]